MRRKALKGVAAMWLANFLTELSAIFSENDHCAISGNYKILMFI